MGQNENQIIDLNNFADGALLYRVNQEAQKVMENIHDPNTDEKKAREITIKLKFVPKKDRKGATTDILVTSKIQPAENPQTEMVIGFDEAGTLTGRELQSRIVNQTFFDSSDGQVKTDIGQSVEEAEQEEQTGVIQFRASK